MDSPSKTSAARTALRRIGWLILIWAGSVAALGAVALGIWMLMKLANMTG
jgi:hypothetical protein